jgi:hypothetical protein
VAGSLDISEVPTASIIIIIITMLIMEAVNVSETLMNLYKTTWQNKPVFVKQPSIRKTLGHLLLALFNLIK